MDEVIFKEMAAKLQEKPVHDAIESPSHYQSETGLECIEVIEAMGHMESFCIASAVKYMWRKGKKSEGTYLQDLKKARQCLTMLIDYLERKGV